jgi:hypothetical protein
MDKNHKVLTKIRSMSHKITNKTKTKILHVFLNSLGFTTVRFEPEIKQKYLEIYNTMIEHCLSIDSEVEIISIVNEAYEIYERSVEPKIIMRSKSYSKEKLNYFEVSVNSNLHDLLDKIKQYSSNLIVEQIIKLNMGRVPQIVTSKDVAKQMLHSLKLNISPTEGIEILESLVELECTVIDIFMN